MCCACENTGWTRRASAPAQVNPMSADETTEWLVDLLYADELEDLEDEHDAPQGADDDPESGLSDAQLVELAGARAFLGEVRRAMPSEALSEEVRTSILSAAREAAAARAASDAAAERRPQVARTPQGSIWSRTQWSTIAQITSVAALLIVGAFSINIFQMQSAEHVSESAPTAARVAADAPPTPAVATRTADFPEAKLQAAGALEAPGNKNTTVALKDAAEKKRADKGSVPDDEIVQAAKTKTPARDRSAEDNAKEAPREEALGAVTRPTRRSAPVREPAREPSVAQAPLAKKATNAPGDGVADLLSNKDQGNASRSYRPQRSATGFGHEFSVADDTKTNAKVAEGQARQEDDYAAQKPASVERKPVDVKTESATAPAPMPTPKPAPIELADARPRLDTSGGVTSTRSGPPPSTTPMTSAPKLVAPAKTDATTRAGVASADPAAPSPKADAAPQKGTPMSVSTIERAYNRSDYRGAVEDADSYLNAGLGTPDERARAMELKADALINLGRRDEGNGVLRELEQKYPEYAKKKGLSKKPSKNRVKTMKRNMSKSNADFDAF